MLHLNEDVMKHIDYTPKGVCSRKISIDVDGDVIVDVSFVGGCSGNTQGVAKLVVGMKAEEAIKRLRGIKCGFKQTSCPDQLSLAIEEAIKE